VIVERSAYPRIGDRAHAVILALRSELDARGCYISVGDHLARLASGKLVRLHLVVGEVQGHLARRSADHLVATWGQGDHVDAACEPAAGFEIEALAVRVITWCVNMASREAQS